MDCFDCVHDACQTLFLGGGISHIFMVLFTYLSLFHLGGVAASSASTSLWGKKLLFWGRPCIWQLQPEVVVPALQELSACMLLRHTHALDWTGFDYKAPGKAHIELGLGGTGTHLSVWLFGEMHSVKRDLKLLEWYTVCVTWSGRAHRLRIYINGTSKYETSVKPILPQQLASHGTLTLGVSHYTINNGEVQPQTGKDLLGEIGLFRMWAREWSAEELKRQSCAEGDVLRWDLRQWKHNCRLEPDNNLHCGKYSLTSDLFCLHIMVMQFELSRFLKVNYSQGVLKYSLCKVIYCR